MPGRRVSLRPTVFHRIVKASEKRENLNEYVVLGIGILTNFIFVIGCILFFEIFPIEVNNIGLWLFLIASLMNVFLSMYVMWEHKEAQEAFEGGARDEFLEHFLYVASGLFFAVGSVLWMPVWGESKARNFVGHSASAWCFVWGSVGLVLASVWNAFGLVEENAKRSETPTKVEVLCRRLASLALCCTAVGGALFVAGSFMFRPAFENDCKEAIERAAVQHPWRHRHHHVGFLQVGGDAWDPRISADSEGREMSWCLSIINQGTWVYLYGCLLFLAQSVISLVVCIIMNRTDARPKMNLMVGRRNLQQAAKMLSKGAQTEEACSPKGSQQQAPARAAGPLVLEERPSSPVAASGVDRLAPAA